MKAKKKILYTDTPEYERFDKIRDELWKNRLRDNELEAQLNKMGLKFDFSGKPENFIIKERKLKKVL